jgi:hypothetical protein
LSPAKRVLCAPDGFTEPTERSDLVGRDSLSCHTPAHTVALFLRFFARTRNSTRFFSSVSALFAKNTRGWVLSLCGYSVFEGRDHNILPTCVWPHTIPGHDL